MCALSISQCINRSSVWLDQIQNKQDGGWGQYQGSDSNSLNTSEAILALVETGCHKAGDVVIQNGVKYLLNQQLTSSNHNNPEDYGSWARTVTKNKVIIHIPDTIRTSLALLTLNITGKSVNDPSVTMGIQWLVNTKNKDGGWGYKCKSESCLFPTCVALKALIGIYNAGDKQLKDTIINGLKHVSSYKNKNGSFGKDPDLNASHTLCVINTLRLLKGQDFPSYETDIKEAIEWIHEDKNHVTNWETETIIVGDSPDSPFNYTFSHINPAIYLAIVGQYTTSQNDITKEALIVTSDNMDRSTKGFCAKRSVSWATANTMLGLESLKERFESFPERESTPIRPGRKQYLLALLLVFTVISGILAAIDKLSVTYASFSFGIILAALLIYGFISEKSFVELFRHNSEMTKKLTKPQE
jgi:prenyltransferase beta subunit